MNNKKWRIGIAVGEVSGDTLGANLIRAFQQLGIEAEFEGIGGTQMQALGFHSLYPMETLSVMGIVEVLKDLRQLFAVRDGLIQYWRQNPIDIFIGIDAPDFNLRLSKKIRTLKLPIKTVQYVSPSVWAWRQKRVFFIKKNIDLVLCLFPFEVEFYKKYNIPAVFVGHPLAQQLSINDQKAAARQGLNLTEDGYYIALLPGSRHGEIQRLLPLLLSSVQPIIEQYPEVKFLIPTTNLERQYQIEELLLFAPKQVLSAVHILQNAKNEVNIGRLAIEASDCVALASGTATLEAMLLHRPMVVIYTLHWLTYWIVKHLIKIPYYALPNIIANQGYVPELIQNNATPQNIARQLFTLIEGTETAEQQINQHRQLHLKLQQEHAMNPAQAILSYLF